MHERLSRYYNEAIVNNNINENLSSSDSQLGSTSSAENTLMKSLLPLENAGRSGFKMVTIFSGKRAEHFS